MAKEGLKLTKTLSEQILTKLADGLSARKIAKELNIDKSVIRRWRDESEEFNGQYARAREIGMDSLADEIIELSDEATPENYNAKRLQIDTRKWSMSKIAPKTYGDKVELGGKGGGPIQFALIKDEDE